jgi:hypothetical protein
MGNTANNNWPTPVATDLVKDGWEAIKDLGDAIDTTLGVYAPSTSGLTLINTTSFSGVASQAFTFASSTYDNYRIMFNLDSNSLTDSNVTIKMRSGATNNSAAAYSFASYLKTRTNSDGNFCGDDTTAGFRICNLDNGGGSTTLTYTAIAIDLFDIFKTINTRIAYNGMFLNTSTLPSMITGAGVHAIQSSFDGIDIISDAATFSGRVSIYGYNK